MPNSKTPNRHVAGVGAAAGGQGGWGAGGAAGGRGRVRPAEEGTGRGGAGQLTLSSGTLSGEATTRYQAPDAFGCMLAAFPGPTAAIGHLTCIPICMHGVRFPYHCRTWSLLTPSRYTTTATTVRQVQAAHAHRALARNAWEDPADPVRQYHDAYGYGSVLREDQQYFQPSRAVPGYARPASAGSVTAAMDALARERERERYRQAVNDVNVSRHFVPGHPQDYNAVGYGAGSPGGRPRRPATAGGRVAAAAAAAAGRGGDVGRPGGAPFDRPNVDRPVTAIDPRVVRAKQQAFVDKRRKPVSEPRAVDQVPLRVRRAEGRRPSPPRVAEGALDGWNGWPVPVPVP